MRQEYFNLCLYTKLLDRCLLFRRDHSNRILREKLSPLYKMKVLRKDIAEHETN